jgi:hypothetical protein
LTSRVIDLFREKGGGRRLPRPQVTIFRGYRKKVVKRMAGSTSSLRPMVSAMLLIFPQMDRSAAAGVVKAAESQHGCGRDG